MERTRREVLKAVAVASTAPWWGPLLLSVAPVGAASRRPWRFPAGGYGPLINDPRGLLDLPKGFRYTVLAEAQNGGLDDGSLTPGRPDAMGSFTMGSSMVVACNHELNVDDPAPVPPTNAGAGIAIYDRNARGGVSLITVNARGQRTSHRPALTGTVRNCAGGVTPWGTWLTCEESEADVDGVPHGYVFEVDPTGNRTNAVPYKAMGRFAHEAAAVDPRTSDVYLTEDNGGSSLLYRFDPIDRSRRFGSLGQGGSLSAMRVPGFSNFGEITVVGTVAGGVGWTPTPPSPGGAVPQDTTGLKNRFADDTVTRGQKLEGAWWFNGKLTFVCSFNDSISRPELHHEGQVFRYDPTAATLTLLAYFPVGGTDTAHGENMSSPDNLSVSAYGGVLWCEDGADPNRIGALGTDGVPFCLARSRQPGELCGVHLSPDGRWMFVNQQIVGRTLAITGPWAAARRT